MLSDNYISQWWPVFVVETVTLIVTCTYSVKGELQAMALAFSVGHVRTTVLALRTEIAEGDPMNRPTMTLALTMMILAAPAYAQNVTMKEEKPGLLQRAKITVGAATATAQAKVPKGKIVSAEIEEEKGKLIFSFDVRTKGKRGIDEVNVDAISGKVVSVQHETPKDEAKERTADKKKP